MNASIALKVSVHVSTEDATTLTAHTTVHVTAGMRVSNVKSTTMIVIQTSVKMGENVVTVSETLHAFASRALREKSVSLILTSVARIHVKMVRSVVNMLIHIHAFVDKE